MLRSIAVALAMAVATPCRAETSSLRVFLRGGPKTHGPGEHDHPAFVEEWKALLAERGAVVEGALEFPNAEELARTDVLVIYAADGGSIHGDDRANLERFLARGGGIVALHDAVCGDDPQWWKTVVGGAWEHGHAKYSTGIVDLYVADRTHPITAGAENFRFDDEIYYDLHMMPEARVLMNGFHTVFDVTPQMWVYEHDNSRAFVSIQGHQHDSFAHPAWRTMLLRGIAWAGKRDVDSLLKPGEADDLRYPPGGPTRPEEASKLIDVHPDFQLSLFAAEPLVVKPIAIDWDARGRPWVAMTPGYPEKARYSNVPAHDEIAILSDTNGDGRMDARKTFYDRLDLVTTFVFHGDGVIVGQSPDILWLRDTDGDDVCDRVETLFTGFGFGDTHAVMSNFHRGPDGWIYATQGYSGNDSNHVTNGAGRDFGKIGNGLFRFKPDGSAIEMVSSYGSNTWGCDFSSQGELFFSMANGAHLRHVVVPERFLEGNRVGDVASWADVPDHDRVVPLLTHTDAPYAQIDFVGGFTAAAGCTFYKGGAWPEEWKDACFVCEPTVHIVHHDVIEPKGVTFTSHKAREPEFIAGRDLWFRPIDTRVGPDGALYVLDFYNQAIVHNDTRGPKHGPTNFAIRPDRDHEHGRIWRVQHKDAKPVAVAQRPAIPDLFAPEQGALPAASSSPRATLLSWLRRGDLAPDDATLRTACTQWPEARDNWTRSAIVRYASKDVALLLHVLGGDPRTERADDLVREAARAALRRGGAPVADRLLAAVARRENEPAIRIAAVEAVVSESRASAPANRPAIEAALSDPDVRVATAALPLVAASNLEGASVAKLADRLQTELADEHQDPGARVRALAALLSLPDRRAQAIEASRGLIAKDATPERQLAALGALAKTDDAAAAKVIAASYGDLASSARDRAFDLLVARASWANALLDRVEEKGVAAADLGPQKIHRLRNHPDPTTSQRAAKLFESLAGASNAKIDDLVKALLPEVEKPGDRAHGKEVFTQYCATCHTAFGAGAKVGPDLSGMGAHGARDLLPMILDPNREVEAGYAEWIVTTKDERMFAGVLVRESNESVLLRSSSGDSTIERGDIDVLRNTGRSPMPTGLESLGAPALRDVIAYLAGDFAGYRLIDLKAVASSSSLAGLYDTKRDAKPMKFARYGVVEHEGTPFEILDPRRTESGCNALVLKGGLNPDWESKIARPRRVEVQLGCAVERVHVLGGIGGWAFPYVKDVKPVVQWTWRYADGSSEEATLQNGVEFADWIGRFDVPGSSFADGLLAQDSWGQVRRFSLQPREKKVVESIVLESFDNEIAPTILAMTAELPGAEKPGTPPREVKPRDVSPQVSNALQPLDVLILGGGSSHDFERWFCDADLATLKTAGISSARYVSSFTDATRELEKLRALVLCTNQPSPDAGFRKGLFEFVARGGGLLVHHPGNWFNWTDWPEYNARLVGGGARGHEKLQEFEVRIADARHAVMHEVPAAFRVTDELYRFERDPAGAAIEVLAVGRSLETGAEFPVVWTVAREKGRTVCITLGHDGRTHDDPAYQRLLANAVKWILQP